MTSFLVWECADCGNERHMRVHGEDGETYDCNNSYFDTCGHCRTETEWVTDGVIRDVMGGPNA